MGWGFLVAWVLGFLTRCTFLRLTDLVFWFVFCFLGVEIGILVLFGYCELRLVLGLCL